MAKRLTSFFGSLYYALKLLCRFVGGKRLEVDETEEILSDIMADEFSTILEDDSAYLVAKTLVQLYNECTHGRRDLLLKLQEEAPRSANAQAVRASNDSSDEEEGEEEDARGEGQGERDDMAMEVESPSSESAPPQGPLIDDDGFELVQKSGRGRRY